MNQNLTTMEGARYKISLKFTEQEDLGDYSIYGSSCHLGCNKHHSDFEILEKKSDSCLMAIPALKAGTHLYQIFIKRISSNQEFLILDGRIEVKNRCGDGVSDVFYSSYSEAEISFNAEEIQVNVTIQEGTKGERGEKGEKGDPFTFSDFTSEQLASLKGEKGDKGDKGDPGEGGNSGGDIHSFVDMMIRYENYQTKYSGYTRMSDLYNKGDYDENGNWLEGWVLDMLNDDGCWYYWLNDMTSTSQMWDNYYISTPRADEITKFISKMDNVINAVQMFIGCTRLGYFKSSLGSLQSGLYMFGSDPYNCTCLNLESVENIADSIGEYYGQIYIGMANELQYDYGDGKYSRCRDALQKIRDKGWTVYEIYSENY